MTAESVRHTPFASWKDPDAWMEAMKGAKWQALLKEEKTQTNKYLFQPNVQKRIKSFTALQKSIDEKTPHLPFDCGPAYINWVNSFIKEWKFKGSKTIHQMRDLVTDGEGVWVTTDISHGAEQFELQYWDSACSTKPKWTMRGVGPDLVFSNGKLYFFKVIKKLISNELICCHDPYSGKNQTRLYFEKSPECNLYFEKGPDGKFQMVRENSQEYENFEITAKGVQKTAKSEKALLEGGSVIFSWKRVGILITQQHAEKTVWYCCKGKVPKKLLHIPAGSVLFDPFASWNGTLPCLIRVEEPDTFPVYYQFCSDYQLRLYSPKIKSGIKSSRITAKSADGTSVHGILAYSEKSKPKYLLCIGYGAYGMPTSIGSTICSWGPLIQNGWCILYTFLRGGGDHDDKWAKAGRVAGRLKTVEDFEALIKAAQKRLDIAAKYTAIHGRSAGGLLMGATLARHPDSCLFSAVYAGVPYVDVLRTTTNKDLPLTTIEYNEFGNPSKRLEDFISVGLISPADSAAVTASPEVFVIARTGLNDSQVYSYEPIKWIRRLRSHDGKGAAPKLVFAEPGQGHFVDPDKDLVQHIQDIALLDSWMDGDLVR